MELVRQYPIVRANRRGRRRAFANGQFMLFDRAAYDAVGGHAAVREELLEDLALARAVADAGKPAGVFLAAGLMMCRMYESFGGFCAGWERIYIEAAHRKVERLWQGAACNWLGGVALPVLTVASLVVSGLFAPGSRLGWIGVALAAAALMEYMAVLVISYRISRVPLWAVPLSLPGAAIVGWVLARGARTLRIGRPIRWGGREYVRPPR